MSDCHAYRQIRTTHYRRRLHARAHLPPRCSSQPFTTPALPAGGQLVANSALKWVAERAPGSLKPAIPTPVRSPGVVIALAMTLLAQAVMACRGGTTGALPGASGSGPAQRPPVELVVSEYHETYTLLLSVSPDNPSVRRPLAHIDHAPNWPPRAVLSASGDRVAYTVLTSDARSAETEGSLWVIDLAQKQPRKLAARIDARTPPVLSADGTRVTVHRAERGPGGIASYTLEDVDVRSGNAIVVAQESAGVRLYPIGYAPDNARLYYARYDGSGAHLIEVTVPGRTVREVARLGDGAARDFHLSPAGDRVLFLAAQGTPLRYRAFAVEITTGVVQAMLPDVVRAEDVGVAWRMTGQSVATVGMVAEGAPVSGEIAAGPDGTALTLRASGFDAPVAWSPDGRFLFARSFSGRSADEPGVEQPVLIDVEGGRRSLPADGPLAFVGWGGNAR